MYQQNPSWREYYRELDPAKRKAILEENLKEAPEDGANDYRLLLYKRRYENPRDPANPVDRMLYQCVNFIQLSKISRFFWKFHKKEVEKSLQDLGMTEWQKYGEAGESALYFEICNAAARYFSTCKDSGYRRMVFGLVGAGDDDRGRQMCSDVWAMTQGVSRLFKMEEELRIWRDAVTAEYLMTIPGAEELYRKMELEKSTK